MTGMTGYYKLKTPFLISPKGEKVDLLLTPWGKVGKGVKTKNKNFFIII